MGRKRITNTAKIMLSLWNVTLFASVWYFVYSKKIFDTHADSAYIITLVGYILIYNWVCDTYHAFRLASSSIPVLIFNQVMSFGMADFVLYIICCVGIHGMANIVPGFVTFSFQTMGSVLIIIVTKQMFVRYMQPQKTLIIYGGIKKEEAQRFGSGLTKKYRHIFDIVDYISENDEKVFQHLLNQYIIIFYEVSICNREKMEKECCERKIRFYYTPSLSDLIHQGATVRELLDTPLVKYDNDFENAKAYGLKRTMDILFSVFLLVLLSPVFLVVSICIKIEDGGPVFYCQDRCTINGKIFRMIKFRSMVVDAEQNGVQPCEENDSRITKVGRVIRPRRLDELPQLLNILLGEMSFVGPRPERVEHVEMYTKNLPEFSLRTRVKAGLTGYAQVFGKYNTTAYDKLRWDLMYIEKQSMVEDFKIILLTLRVIFRKESTEGFASKYMIDESFEIKE